MKKIIYIVTDGDYSDYGIVNVFTNKKKAERYCQHFRGDIEEWEADQPFPRIPVNKHAFFVQMLRDGNAFNIVQRKLESHNRSIDGDVVCRPIKGDEKVVNTLGITTRKFCLWNSPSESKYVLEMTVLATSKEHAVKIVNEYRAQLIANNDWPVK